MVMILIIGFLLMSNTTEYPDLSTVYPAPTAMPPVPQVSEYPTLEEAYGSSTGNFNTQMEEPSLMDKAKDVGGKLASIIGKASQIAEPLISAVMPGSGIPEMAQAAAPGIAQSEGQIASDAGLAAGYPKTGAAIGTGIAMIPDIAAAATTIPALKGTGPLMKGLMTSPEELGPAMQAGEEAAGIDTGTLPVRRGTVMKFPGLDGLPTNTPPPEAPNVAPSVYSKDTSTFLNTARQRVDSLGEEMQPQELADYRVILNNMIKGGEVKPGTKPYALASQLYTDTNSLFTQAVAGRADLNEVYKYAKIMPSIGDALGGAVKKYGPRVVQGALAIGGGGAVWEGIKHLFGGGKH